MINVFELQRTIEEFYPYRMSRLSNPRYISAAEVLCTTIDDNMYQFPVGFTVFKLQKLIYSFQVTYTSGLVYFYDNTESLVFSTVIRDPNTDYY